MRAPQERQQIGLEGLHANRNAVDPRSGHGAGKRDRHGLGIRLDGELGLLVDHRGDGLKQGVQRLARKHARCASPDEDACQWHCQETPASIEFGHRGAYVIVNEILLDAARIEAAVAALVSAKGHVNVQGANPGDMSALFFLAVLFAHGVKYRTCKVRSVSSILKDNWFF